MNNTMDDEALQRKKEWLKMEQAEVELLERRAAACAVICTSGKNTQGLGAGLEYCFLTEYSKGRSGSDTINTRFLYSKYKEFAVMGNDTPLPHAAFTNAVLGIDGISRASKSKKNQPATYLIDWPSVHVSLG